MKRRAGESLHVLSYETAAISYENSPSERLAMGWTYEISPNL